MFNHVMVGTNNVERARAFYDAVLGPLGHRAEGIPGIAVYRHNGATFAAIPPRNGEPATVANGGTIAFRAKTPAEVDAFHAAGLAAGGVCEGPPGVRQDSPGRMYGAYLRDPDGNKVCAFAPSRSAADG